MLQYFPKIHLLTITGLAGLLITGVATSTDYAIEPQRTIQAVELKIASTQQIPTETPTQVKAPIQAKVALQDEVPIEKNAPPPTPIVKNVVWQKEIVKNGDNLSLLFNRVGLSDSVLYRFMKSNEASKQLTKIHPGQEVFFNISEDGHLEGLRYQKTRLKSVEFSRSDKGFSHSVVTVKPDTKPAYKEVTIVNSLFLAGTNAGMEESLIMELASIFGWDIDFALDIRANDSFKVLYNEQFINGEKLGNGPILAAEFTNQNTSYRAVRYVNKNGEADYFTPEGKSMRKAFLRTPVDFARISSHFNLKRKHPILNRIRAHKGTDYAAPTGTPIKAAGNGRVIHAATKGGYGKTVIIRHGQTYKTLYAHMHKYGRGIKVGTKVKQGQIIGYVGKSGLATGPHLHYEFHKNGVVRNPVKVRLPKAKSIPKSLRDDFKLQTRPLVAQLNKFDGSIQLAATKDNRPNTNN